MKSWGRFFVSYVPMSYPNTTKREIPPVYPLSVPVKGVDGKFNFFFLAGLGFRRNGALERMNPTKTMLVACHMSKSVVRVVKCQDPTPGVTGFTGITYSLASFST